MLEKDQYEIAATIPQDAGKGDIPAMLRSLLDDRFPIFRALGGTANAGV